MIQKLKELITDDSNITLQPAYVWGALMIVIGLLLEIVSFFTGKAFNFAEYGVGCGALIALIEGGKKLGS